MTRWHFMGSTALVALVSGNMALADVTPEQVWKSWQDTLTTSGQTITAESEARDGDALVISGVTVTSKSAGSTAEIVMDALTFTDLGDGTVEITLPEDYPVNITAEASEAGAAPTEIEVTIRNPDMTITASGAADETRYDFDAPSLTVELTHIQGVKADKIDLVAKAELTALEGNYVVRGTTDRALTSAAAAKNVVMTFAVNDPEAGSSMHFNANVADLAGTSTAALISGVDMTNMAAALAAGFATDSNATYGATDYSFDFADKEQSAASNGSVGGGNFAVAINKARIAYAVGSKAVALTFSGSTIPFPQVAVNFAESAFNMLIPVGKSDMTTDFSVLTKVVDLTVSDEVWGMFDPTKTLPRDPVTLVVDAKGTGKLNVDLMDTAAMSALAGAMPGELNSLDLTELRLTAAGAELTGSGALTFDNSDLVTFNGVPAPTGIVDLKVVGANGLMDKLVAMGLLPQDQVMGARMMLGMFAKMVEGQTDTMTSALEFKNKGFFANGMQLK